MFYASIAITITLLYIVFASSARLEKKRKAKLASLGRDSRGRFSIIKKAKSKHYVKCFYLGQEQKGFYIYD